jgi:hypothetical protein
MNDDALAREEQRWAALISNDFEALDSLVHASLTYTHSNAAVDTKESWIRSVTSGFVDYRSVEREDVEITIVARFTAVWVNEDDRWQFYAWQNTPIPG